MKKIDARKRTTKVQQYIREQAIRPHLPGKNRETIAEIVGVHKTTVGEWITLYNRQGIEGLKIGQRGRRAGDGRLLTSAQESRLKEVVNALIKYGFLLYYGAAQQFALWLSKCGA